jgi:hypothetical protein
MRINESNQSCDFAETLVSYLYDEIGAQESVRFQMHLANCGECAAELAGFDVARSSIAEWREQDFAPMSAPAINLPVIVTDETEILVPEKSWLDNLRAFLTFSPGFAMAGIAALLVCAGLAFVVLNSQNMDDRTVAENRPVRQKPAANVNSASDNEMPLPAKESPVVPDNADKKIDDRNIENPQPARAAKAGRQKAEVKAVKTSAAPVTPVTPRQKALPKNNDSQQAKSLPALSDDYEDDSLRLADLFAEADTE